MSRDAVMQEVHQMTKTISIEKWNERVEVAERAWADASAMIAEGEK